MFRKMRRIKQCLPEEETVRILEQGTSGVLAVTGENGYPYAVPLSYVFDPQKKVIYFHSAKNGHKIDAIARSPKASFCVIAQDTVVPEEYTTYFKSVIVFGTVCVLENPAEKRAAIELLAEKYAPGDSAEHRNAAIDREFAPLCMLEMRAEHITGKAAIELVRASQAQKNFPEG